MDLRTGSGGLRVGQNLRMKEQRERDEEHSKDKECRRIRSVDDQKMKVKEICMGHNRWRRRAE